MAKRNKQENQEEKERRRRIRSPHPGVVLTRRTWPSGEETWFARWFDPDTGKRIDTNLNKLEKTNAETRKTWAISKSKSLAARRADIEAGIAPKTATPLSEAYEAYLVARGAELSASTIRNYRDALNPFVKWCAKNGVSQVEDVTPQRLAAFREDHLRVTARKQKKGKGAGRGGKVESARRRSPHTVNREFRSTRTLLSYWRRRGITPALNSDSIRDTLGYVRTPKPLPRFLSTDEVKALVKACIKHDGRKFLITRAEHAKGLTKGSTPRYQPILPYVYAALLTGARFDELRTLECADVDLQQNVIVIRSEAAKLKIARRIDLAVSPSLAEVFWAIKETGAKYVFGGDRPMSRSLIQSSQKRLIAKFKAPDFTWHDLRRTAGTFLTCAPTIYGGASAFLSAKRLGHSVAVAEKHYVGAVTNIPATATTLEGALGLSKLAPAILGSVRRSLQR